MYQPCISHSFKYIYQIFVTIVQIIKYEIEVLNTKTNLTYCKIMH